MVKRQEYPKRVLNKCENCAYVSLHESSGKMVPSWVSQ